MVNQDSVVERRPARFWEEGDMEFLRRLYDDVRREELAGLGWPEEALRAFLDQQFEVQHAHYLASYPKAEFELLLSPEGELIGRCYFLEAQDCLHLIDLSLLSKWRGRGLGTALLLRLLGQAAERAAVVRLHVEQNNRARWLYERLGFSRVGENGPYYLLEAQPSSREEEV